MTKMIVMVVACVSMMANAQWVCENGQWHPINMSSIGMYMGGGCGGNFTNRVSNASNKCVISLSRGGNKPISLSKGGSKKLSLSNGGSKKLTLTTKKTGNKSKRK